MPPSSTARKNPPSHRKRLMRAERSSASAESASGRTAASRPATATAGRCSATRSGDAPENNVVRASASCWYSAANRRSTSRAFETWSYIHQPTCTVEINSSARKPSCSAKLGSRFNVIEVSAAASALLCRSRGAREREAQGFGETVDVTLGMRERQERDLERRRSE